METGTDFHGSVIRVKTRPVHDCTEAFVVQFSGIREILEKKRAREYGGVAQLGEHLPCKQGVMGSNPIISTIPGNREHGKMGKNQPKENGL